MVQKKQTVVLASSESSDSSVSEVRNAFAALNEDSSDDSTSSEESSTGSEESSGTTSTEESSTSEDESAEESSEDSSDESETSSSDESSSSGFFSDASSELNVSRWVTVEESSEDEGPISKEKKDKAQLIREKWLKKKDEIRTDEMEDDSGEEFTGRLRWMKRDYRERFLHEHGLSDLIKSKDTKKQKKERKENHKKKEVKFSDVILEKKDEELTSDNVMNRFYDLLDPKNRLGSEFLTNLQVMLNVADKNNDKLKILLTLVNAKFDYSGSAPVDDSPEHNLNTLSYTYWKEASVHIDEILSILEQNPSIIVHEIFEPLPDDEVLIDDSVSYENEFNIKGSIVGIIERFDEEFTKILQNVDSSEIILYEEIYSKEYLIISLIERASIIYKRLQSLIKSKEDSGTVRLTLRLLEKLYYRSAHSNQSIFDALNIKEDALSSVVNCARYLIAQSDAKIAAKAYLLLIYHLAVNNHFNDALHYFNFFYYSDYLVDVNILVLYNRTRCLIALSAFQLGYHDLVVELLFEFYRSDSVVELLGQTSSAFLDATIEANEFESTEKKKALPFHLQIDKDILECALFTSMMVIEFNWIKLSQHTETPDVYFKELYLEFVSNHNVPPESSKDYVFMITHALMSGDYRKGIEIAQTSGIWKFLSNDAKKTLIQ
eukprot:NODE_182_length_15748_cov_0.173174.p1 type:complete len:661 gc:universal NODE_182_length_15748_cov_0.173174:6554-4572(-)